MHIYYVQILAYHLKICRRKTIIWEAGPGGCRPTGRCLEARVGRRQSQLPTSVESRPERSTFDNGPDARNVTSVLKILSQKRCSKKSFLLLMTLNIQQWHPLQAKYCGWADVWTPICGEQETVRDFDISWCLKKLVPTPLRMWLNGLWVRYPLDLDRAESEILWGELNWMNWWGIRFWRTTSELLVDRHLRILEDFWWPSWVQDGGWLC